MRVGRREGSRIASGPGWSKVRRADRLDKAYRFDWPRTIFFTFFLAAPRGVVRLAFGAAFLRAVRFSFFRSRRSSILVVSTCNLFRCYLFNVSGFPVDASLMVTAIRRTVNRKRSPFSLCLTRCPARQQSVWSQQESRPSQISRRGKPIAVRVAPWKEIPARLSCRPRA